MRTGTLLLIGPFQNEAQKFLTAFSSKMTVIHAIEAKEGYEKLETEKSKHFLTILLDLYVEDEDGLDVLQTLKSKSPMTEVITLSPESNPEWAIEVMRSGGYAFETYDLPIEVIEKYLDQIQNQFDLFKTAEQICKDKLIDEWDKRLSLASEIMAKRRFDGTPLSGAELNVFFPVHPDTIDAVQALKTQFQNGEDPSKKARILIVEDEESVADAIKSILIGLLKYDVIHAQSIHDALEIIVKEKPFQAALFDIGLPDGRGTTLIKPVLEKMPDIQIIMLTAYKDIQMILESFQSGATDYINKPFNSYQLQQVVSKAIQRNICKAFLPTVPKQSVMSTQAHPPIAAALFKELVTIRKGQQKPLHLQEISIFLPSFRPAVTHHRTKWIDSSTFGQNLADDMKKLAEDVAVKLSKEEEDGLLK